MLQTKFELQIKYSKLIKCEETMKEMIPKKRNRKDTFDIFELEYTYYTLYFYKCTVELVSTKIYILQITVHYKL